MFSSHHLLCLYKQPPLLKSDHNGILLKERMKLIRNPLSSINYCCKVQAVKEDSSSQKYEIDPEKAREALRKLDQEIQKPMPPPKVKVSEVKLSKEQRSGMESEKKLEISESFLGSLAAGLVLFTIFYNVIFYTLIKPAIDASY